MDMERVIEKLADHDIRLQKLEEYEKKQNGSLLRMADKMDRLDEKLDKKFDKLLYWIIGSFFTTIMLLAGVLLRG